MNKLILLTLICAASIVVFDALATSRFIGGGNNSLDHATSIPSPCQHERHSATDNKRLNEHSRNAIALSGEESQLARSKRSSDEGVHRKIMGVGPLTPNITLKSWTEDPSQWNLSIDRIYVPTTSISVLDHEHQQLMSTNSFPVDQWRAFGLFDDEYINKINVHWLKFPSVSRTAHLVVAGIYIFIMAVGCFGNLLVIIMFSKCRSLRTPANYLILNLTISDFLMLAKMPIAIINSFYEGPVFGSLGCQIYGFFGGLTGTCSIMTLAAIAVDRYCVIVFPLNPYKRTTHARAFLMVVFVWIYSIIFSTLPLFGINQYVSEGFLTTCSFDYMTKDVKSRIFIFIFFVAAWVVPLSCIGYSYLKIFRMVVEAEQLELFGGSHQRESAKNRRMQEKLRKDVKIAMLTTMIIVVWFLAWTPYAAVALLGIFGFDDILTPVGSVLPSMFCKLSSCINPFIYSISHPRFQKEFQARFRLLCKCAQRKAMRKTSPNSIVTYGNSISDNYEYQTGKFDICEEDLMPDSKLALKKLTVHPEQNIVQYSVTVLQANEREQETPLVSILRKTPKLDGKINRKLCIQVEEKQPVKKVRDENELLVMTQNDMLGRYSQKRRGSDSCASSKLIRTAEAQETDSVRRMSIT